MSNLLHRITILLVCLVWPLIWVGGQVTTYDAGMAVPDWPGTYGYNLFLYPYETWLYGPFDLFIEHGHRLLGALVGMVAIAAVVTAFLTEQRRWVRWLTVAVLIAVCAQGGLGGARVVLADRTLAMLHGCLAELFFSLCVVLLVVTGRWWATAGDPATGDDWVPSRRLIGWTATIAGLAFVQVLLGAQLRHVQPVATPGAFKHLVYSHLATALVVLLMTLLLAWRLRFRPHTRFRQHTGEAKLDERKPDESKPHRSKRGCGDLALSLPSVVLLTLVGFQITLGLATWVARYGLPRFAQATPDLAAFLVKSQAFFDSLVITAHVAVGALVLVTAVFLCLRLARARDTRARDTRARGIPHTASDRHTDSISFGK